jgi:hypothetical protein
VVQPHIVPHLPSEQWMLIRRIAANEQNGGILENVLHAGSGTRFVRKSTKEGGKIRRPVVIDIVGPKDNPCDLLQ